MSDFSLNHYKRALLYNQLKVSQLPIVDFIDPFSNTKHAINLAPNSKKIIQIVGVASAIAILHFSVWWVAKQLPTQALVTTTAKPVLIEIVKPLPKEKPPKVIEPEIPPVKKQVEIPPVAEQPKQISKPVEKTPTQTKTASVQPTPQPVIHQPVAEPIVAENTRPVPVSKPEPAVAAETAPPSVSENNVPVTEAKGYAGYLSNPAPDYPDVALERGWEGSVVLRVKVSATGSPLSVEIKQGSGKKVLDDAAIRTVKRWKFSPAMRGSTAIEGWVDVPVNYQLPA